MKTTAEMEHRPGSVRAPREAVEHSEAGAVPLRSAFVPNATAFIASGCIMVVEILSGRLVSPFLGSSLYTWTSAIGVVLAGISIGNYIGGRLADRFQLRRTLSVLFLLASASCMAVPALNGFIGEWEAMSGLNWPTRIFLHFLAAFLLPATLLGTIGPVVAKMALSMGRATGRTIGTIYAWGAVGSIAGTFMAGFLLIAWMGTAATIFTVAGILAVMGLLYGYRSWVPYAWGAAYAAALICAVGPWSSTRAMAAKLHLRPDYGDDVVYSKESQYQLIRVQTAVGDSNERLLLLDKLMHSKVNLKDPLDLKYTYEFIYDQVMRSCHPEGKPLAALVIGGGGFTFPRYLELRYPGSHIEVAEIDPAVTEAAHAEFGLPRNTSVKTFNMDARNHVADLVRRRRMGDSAPSFDFIYGDSFSDFSVPYHLNTLEFNRELAELLNDRGVYMLNMIDMLNPGRFLGAVVDTCREAFPHVYAFKTNSLDDDRDTFVVVGSKRPLELGGVVEAIRSSHEFAGRMLTAEDFAALAKRSGGMVLTDDFAPVENLLAPVVRKYRPIRMDEAETFLADVIRLIEGGQLDRAGERCRAALNDKPENAKARLYLGVVLSKQGKFSEAIGHYREAIRLNTSDPKAHVNLGMALAHEGDLEGAVAAYHAALRIDSTDVNTRHKLALALAKLDRVDEAVAECRQAVTMRPGFVEGHYTLGVLSKRGLAFDTAVAEFEEVLKLRPDHPEARRALAAVLLEGGKPAEAIPHLREALKADSNRAELHDKLGRALSQTNDSTAAVESMARAVELEPANADYHQNFGMVLEGAHRPADAATQYKESLRLNPANPAVTNTLARMLAASSDDQLRDCTEALRWAQHLVTLVQGEDSEVLDTQAIARACAGSYQEAVNIGRRAVDLARSQGQTELAGQIESRIKLYESGRPYREDH